MPLAEPLFPSTSASAGVLGAAGTGAEFVYMKAAAARAAGDVVFIGASASGLVDVTITDVDTVNKYAVATKTMASGDYGWYQVRGRCTITTPSITTTAGNGIRLSEGAIADSGSAAQTPNDVSTNSDFGVTMTSATSATSQDVYLFGGPCTAAT